MKPSPAALAAALLLAGCSEEASAPKASPKPMESPAARPAATAPSNPLLDPNNPAVNLTAPEEFKVKFSTSKGDFTVHVTRAWAPKGADRFYSLVKNNFYDEARFFRVIRGFVAQFGIHGDPKVSAAWMSARIQDDPVTQSNRRGTLTYATAGPNSRTTQLFINYADNSRLDGAGFAPFGRVTEGMDVVDQLHADYGEGPPGGRGPSQGLIQQMGNEYLIKDYPNLDYIKTARIVQ